MKLLSIFAILFLNAVAFGQNKSSEKVYSTFQVNGYITEYAFGGGALVSFGYHKNGFCIGPGLGIVLIGHDNPYIPLYANIAYVGGKSKVSPMANMQFGKGVYAGDNGKGGFYGLITAGAGVKFNKVRLHLFGGLSFMNNVYAGIDNDVNEQVLTAGISFFTTN